MFPEQSLLWLTEEGTKNTLSFELKPAATCLRQVLQGLFATAETTGSIKKRATISSRISLDRS
jgi:hypothetical protein